MSFIVLVRSPVNTRFDPFKSILGTGVCALTTKVLVFEFANKTPSMEVRSERVESVMRLGQA